MAAAKNILITGASGFTARHLAARLQRDNETKTLVGVVRSERESIAGFNLTLTADLTDFAQTLRVIRQVRPDAVYHTAGVFRGSAPELYRANLLATANLLEAIKSESPQASVLSLGSAAEYGIWPPEDMPLVETHECKPVSPYGLSKYMATLAALDYARNGLKVIVARPFNIVGAGMPATLVAGAIVERAQKALRKGQRTITIGNAQTIRDFIPVEDAVEAYVALLKSERWGEVFNVCSGQGTSIQALLDTLLSFAPTPITVTVDESLKRAGDAPVAVGDFGKARAASGFTPRVSLKAALRDAWDESMEVESPILAGKN